MKALNHTGFDRTLEHEKKAIHHGKNHIRRMMVAYNHEIVKTKDATHSIGLHKYKKRRSHDFVNQ